MHLFAQRGAVQEAKVYNFRWSCCNKREIRRQVAVLRTRLYIQPSIPWPLEGSSKEYIYWMNVNYVPQRNLWAELATILSWSVTRMKKTRTVIVSIANCVAKLITAQHFIVIAFEVENLRATRWSSMSNFVCGLSLHNAKQALALRSITLIFEIFTVSEGGAGKQRSSWCICCAINASSSISCWESRQGRFTSFWLGKSM